MCFDDHVARTGLGPSTLERLVLSSGWSDVGVRRNAEPVRHCFGKAWVAACADLLFAQRIPKIDITIPDLG